MALLPRNTFPQNLGRTVDVRHVPDGITPVVAWRCWRYDQLISGIGYPAIWKPRERMEATCQCLRDHESPDEYCSCGIYAKKDVYLLIEEFNPTRNSGSVADPAGVSGRTLAIGEVYLWGKIVEATHGFRAQYAYPKSFWAMNCDQTLDICYRYKIQPIEEGVFECELARSLEPRELSHWRNLYQQRQGKLNPMETSLSWYLQPEARMREHYLDYLNRIQSPFFIDKPGARTATGIEALRESTSSVKPAEKKGDQP